MLFRSFGLNELTELPRPDELDSDLSATVEARELAPITSEPTAIRVDSDVEDDEDDDEDVDEEEDDDEDDSDDEPDDDPPREV